MLRTWSYRALLLLRLVWLPLALWQFWVAGELQDPSLQPLPYAAFAAMWIVAGAIVTAHALVRANSRLVTIPTFIDLPFALAMAVAEITLLAKWAWPACPPGQDVDCWPNPESISANHAAAIVGIFIFPYIAITGYEFARLIRAMADRRGMKSPAASPGAKAITTRRPGHIKGTYAQFLRSRTTFGAPGQDLSGTAGAFGSRNVSLGQYGEQLTASLLEQVQTRLPGSVVFHGLPWPQGKADVDHAIVRGSLVVFIDSKYWKPAQYGMDQYGALTRDGEVFQGGMLHMDAAVQSWRPLLPRGTRTLSTVAIHPASAKPDLHVPDGLSTAGGTLVIAADRLVESLASWLAQEAPEADISIVDAFYRRMYQAGKTI